MASKHDIGLSRDGVRDVGRHGIVGRRANFEIAIARGIADAEEILNSLKLIKSSVTYGDATLLVEELMLLFLSRLAG